MKTTRRCIALSLVLAALSLGPACIQKSIGIRSEPPGATVYLDGVEVGRTPVDYIPFDFYGTREIVLARPGYLPERRIVAIDEPWYETFPIDIFTDLLIPWNVQDRRSYYFALRRTEPVERAVLLEHAQDTRLIAAARIEGARREFSYTPRQFAIQGAPKQSILWGPFFAPPRKNLVPAPTAPEPEKK